MRKHLRLYFCLIALGIILPVAAFAAGGERLVEESFEVAAGTELFLESHKGEVRIRTADVSTIQMTARIHTDEGSDEGSDEGLELVSIETSSGKGYVKISVDYDQLQKEHRSGLFQSEDYSMPLVDFDIVMPDSGRLKLESHKSELKVEAPSGEVRIDTHKGEGHITNVRSDFTLSTHKGDFKVEIEEMGDIDIETHKGNVNLRIHGATDFSIRGESHKGDFSFDGYDIPIERKDDGEKWISHKVGSSEHRINLETHKGDISIAFVN
jgi:hypothetical protein